MKPIKLFGRMVEIDTQSDKLITREEDTDLIWVVLRHYYEGAVIQVVRAFWSGCDADNYMVAQGPSPDWFLCKVLCELAGEKDEEGF